MPVQTSFRAGINQLLVFLLLCLSYPPVWATDEVESLKGRVAALEKELAQIRALLQEREAAGVPKEEIQLLKDEVRVARATQGEWKYYDSRVHLAGYAAAGYATEDESGNDGFGEVLFAPIFHYGYKDLFLLESELEIEVGDEGATELALEYLTVDWFINDYATLVAGKFLSPIGQFQQNFHPSWINKMPSNPVGFGHGGATPLAEVGVQLRGGFQMPMLRQGSLLNYAFYVGNGPQLEVGAHGEEEEEEGMGEEEELEIEEIGTEGFISDIDDEKVFGGRIGFVPLANVEIGLSGAWGNVALEEEPDRDYEAWGADFFGRWRNLDFRTEWVRQEFDDEASSMAPEGQGWEAWYAQASYKLLPTRLELVARYSDLDSSHDDQDRTQWAIGINYLFSAQAIAKLAYEINDAFTGLPEDENRLLLQLAYGF